MPHKCRETLTYFRCWYGVAELYTDLFAFQAFVPHNASSRPLIATMRAKEHSGTCEVKRPGVILEVRRCVPTGSVRRIGTYTQSAGGLRS